MTMYPSRDDIAAAARILGTSNPSARMSRNGLGSWTVASREDPGNYATVEERQFGDLYTGEPDGEKFLYCDCLAWAPSGTCSHVQLVAASLHR